ncbi:hypothetical protein [Roseospirillum parvum]|uniref:Uncharacterized protein n=1 Tax=Roseospirillum parvum TaxID=83401 RepID=A0A1G7Y7A1_9PROT|nr:hypothetical protein [Roseospirillum parvum]SDG92328.1 hypothetical protein SAMN05421742_103213 [Roseospirillum parvum]
MRPHLLSVRLAALLVALWATPPALAQQDVFRFGAWKGQAFFDHDSGAFTYCAAGQIDEALGELSFFLSRNRVPALGVHRPDWHLKAAAPPEVGLTIDGRITHTVVQASVPDPHFLVLPLPMDDLDLMQAVAAMRALEVHAAGRTARFQVKDLRQVIFRLNDCVDVRLRAEAANN